MTTRMKVFKIWLDWDSILENEPDVREPCEREEHLVFGYRYREDAVQGFIAAGLADYEFGEPEPERFVGYIRCQQIDLYDRKCVSIKEVRQVPIRLISQ